MKNSLKTMNWYVLYNLPDTIINRCIVNAKSGAAKKILSQLLLDATAEVIRQLSRRVEIKKKKSLFQTIKDLVSF